MIITSVSCPFDFCLLACFECVLPGWKDVLAWFIFLFGLHFLHLVSWVIGWFVTLGHLGHHPFTCLPTQNVKSIVEFSPCISFDWCFCWFDFHLTSLKSFVYLPKHLFSGIDYIVGLVFGKVGVSLIWMNFSFHVFIYLESLLSRKFFHWKIVCKKFVSLFHEKVWNSSLLHHYVTIICIFKKLELHQHLKKEEFFFVFERTNR